MSTLPKHLQQPGSLSKYLDCETLKRTLHFKKLIICTSSISGINYRLQHFQRCTMVSSTNGSTEVKKPFQRLPTGVVPSHYKVFLRPNLVDLIFTGNVSVELDVVQPTSELVCNAVDLKVDSVKINGSVHFSDMSFFKLHFLKGQL